MKKILVTGAAGFIGFHLAESLVQDGHEVVGIDNINDYYDVNLKYARLAESGINRNFINDGGELIASNKYNNYQFSKIDITDLSRLEMLFKNENFTHVVNLAAQAGVRYSIENPGAYIQSNIVGFLNILECCRYNDIKHLLYASSSSVYGANKEIPFKTSHNVDHPVSLYAATKKSNELMAHTYSHLYNIPTTGLRFFTVYGPWGRPDMAPILFADAMSNNRAINVFNNGEMERDFTYIDDIVEGVIRVMNKPPTSGDLESPYLIHNIGNGNPIKLMDFISVMEKHIGFNAIRNFMPMQPGDVKRTWADTSSLEQSVDYKPQTSLEIGVKEFVIWFNKYYQSA
jgi:UDP-glucuronate 4-epimerase